MRLTLRTLLAYIDDTLEPQQAREIGQKVAESPPARELIERIRQVVRRRRLAAPDVAAGDPDFDANAVAQYLDSSLPDEEITILEEKCLADDQRLAEVASCHQILTLVLGEAAHVPPTARARMYELVRDPIQTARRKERVQGVGERKVPAANHEDADEKLLLGLPGGSGGQMRFWTPFLAGCLLVGALVALWMSMGGFGRRELAQLNSSDNGDAEPIPEKKVPDSTSKPGDSGRQPVNASENVAEKPAPPAKEPVLDRTPSVVEKPVTPVHSSPSIERPAFTVPPGTRRFEMGHPTLIAGVPNMLLEHEPDQPSWTRLPPEKGRVWATDQLLVLPGYRADVRLDCGIQLVLWGSVPELSKSTLPLFETRVTINSQPGIDLDLTLDRGRVLLTNTKKEGPAYVRVRFASEIWDLTLHDPNSEVALELVATCVPYTGAGAKELSDIDVALLVFKGEVSLRGKVEEFLIRPTSIVTWENGNGTTSRPSELPRLPAWYLVKEDISTPAARDALQALENLGRITTTKKLDVALSECLHSPEAATRQLAVRCQAALGDVSAMFGAMADDKHPEVRLAGVEGLRHLLAVSPDSVREIGRLAREKNLNDKQVATIRQLLQGFPPQQWLDPRVQATVVDYLLYDKLIIRQMAYCLLLRSYPEGQKIGYDAAADLRKREHACEEWKALIQPKKPPGSGQ
jgi:hypothetical protein